MDSATAADAATAQRADQLADAILDHNYRNIDRLFVWLMAVQWVAGIATALFVSPYTWIGERSLVHIHLWAAIVVGGLISAAPIWLGIKHPGHKVTRHVIAIAQALWGALLIHLSGGRLETHFHVFGSLAFIAFYRDWAVIVTMTVVVAVDHAVRGMFFPLSVYGIVLESPYRWIEHTVWVLFEDVILLFSCRRGREEVQAVCIARAELEKTNRLVERKVKERTQELKDASEHLQQMSLIAKYTDNAVVIMKPDCTIELVNDGFERLYGYEFAEVKGRRPHDFLLGADSSPETVSLIHSRLSSGRGCDVELCKYRKSGEAIWVSIEVRPIYAADGQLRCFVSLARDVTEQRKQEQRLQLLREAIDSANDSLLIIRDDGGFVDVNATACERLGYTREQLLQLSLPEVEHSLKLKSWAERWEAVQSGEAAELNGNYISQTGTVFPVEVSAVPVSYQGVSYFCAFARDISERKQAEEEREQLNFELQRAARQAGMAELAADILHNIGNALNGVNVSLQTIHKGIESKAFDVLLQATGTIRDRRTDLTTFLNNDPQGRMFPELLIQLGDRLKSEREHQRSELQELQGKIEHIKEVVASQESFSQRRTIIEPISPTRLFEEAIRMNEYSSTADWLQIERRFTEIEDVDLEKHRVIQVLVNLIKNAREALAEAKVDDPRVILSTKTVDDFVCFEVTDNGVGIPEQNLVEIFYHGFTTKKTGSGFGLHSCANLVQEMGGALTVHSGGIDCGATFTVRLPLSRKTVLTTVEK